MTETDWAARHAALIAADGDEWDALSEAYDADWKAEYKAAFVAHALTRPGWDRDNAEAWADGIADDALCSNPDLTPTHVAQTDVIECERESANAG